MRLSLSIAKLLKEHVALEAGSISTSLGITYEAVRQELSQMHDRGEVAVVEPQESGKRGRPSRIWKLTPAGEHLFPKSYAKFLADLSLAIESNGVKSSIGLLEHMVDSKLENLEGQLQSANSIEGKLRVLTRLYDDEDEYISVKSEGGEFFLEERNCPILNIASQHSWVCSVSTNLISKATGRKVQRTSKFQNGDGKCVFQIIDEASSEVFELEQ